MSGTALARLETIIGRANRKETWLAWNGEILLAAERPREAQAVFSETLKAIEALPPRMRMSPGMVLLRAKVAASLAAQRAGDEANKKPSGERLLPECAERRS